MGTQREGGGGLEGQELDELLEAVRQRVAQARAAARQVAIGFTVGAEADAVRADLRRLERAGVTEADRADLVALHARATRALTSARRQARANRGRQVGGTAGIHLSR